MGGPARLLFQPPTNSTTNREDIFLSVVAMLEELEKKYSRYIDNSLVSQINERSGSGVATPIDEETRGLIAFCRQLHQESDGLFDPTAGVLNKAWDFKGDQMPDRAIIERLLTQVGWDEVHINKNGISLNKPNSQIDLGGVVKEYAADKAVKLLRELKVTRALVELAGDIATLGAKTSELPWQIGISDPETPEKAIISVELTDACLATSGSSQRFIDIDGQRYSHFLNPKTGHPAEGSFSVSVIAETCLMAGSIATVACLMGTSNARSWLESSGLPWLMISGEKLSGPIAEHTTYAQSTVAPPRSAPSPQ